MVGTCVRCNSPCVQYVLSLKINNVAPMISYVFMGVSSDYSLHRYKTVVLHWGCLLLRVHWTLSGDIYGYHT